MIKKSPIKRSIRRKLMLTFGIAVIILVLCCLATSAVSINLFRKNTEEQMTEQAIASGEVFASGFADEIGAQMSNVITAMYDTRDYIEYIYDHPDQFTPRKIPLPKDVIVYGGKDALYWIPQTAELREDPAIVAEAEMLSAVEPMFSAVKANNELFCSIYAASESGLAVRYDVNMHAYRGTQTYDPRRDAVKWYDTAKLADGLYMTEAYADPKGGGLMFSISLPYYVNGKIQGVLGSNILIESIKENLLDVDTASGSSYAMLFTKSGQPMAAPNMNEKTTASELLGGGKNVAAIVTQDTGYLQTELNGENVYIFYETVEETGWVLTVVLPVESILAPVEESIASLQKIGTYQLIVILVLLAGALFSVYRLSISLTNPLIKLTDGVDKMSDGNLDYVSEIHTGDELEMLSSGFEQMTVSLKSYIENIQTITAEKERIGAELDVAAHIQSSMLPCIFPAFPDRKEIDIYATMNPAKEVGGDFYDFFMVDERHVAIVMADVSGKGVPAALFMVIGKTLIKDHTQAGLTPDEIFGKVNNLLCESNSEGLFITAFEGILDMLTGEFIYVNAGHEMPFICKKNDKFHPYKIRPGFVLAGMEDMRFRAGSMMLEPGDKVFQYTDGVTEATDANNNLYGMERLESILGQCSDKTPEEILPAVKADIDAFVGEAPQFDDITMLCLEFREKMDQPE